MTPILLTLIIGHDLVRTYVSTHFSSPTSTLTKDCESASQPPSPCQWNLRIRHITTVQELHRHLKKQMILHQTRQPIRPPPITPTTNLSCQQLLIIIAVAYHIYLTFQFVLVTLTKSHQSHCMCQWTTRFLHMCIKSFGLIGLSTRLGVDTLRPPSPLATFLSTSSLHAINMNLAVRYFSNCPHLFSSGNELLNHIQALGDNSQVHAYLIYSLRFKDANTTSTFWQLQSTIIAQLGSLQNLQMVVAVIIPNHDERCVKTFTCHLK